jgi:nicotinamidase-related amidase
MDLAELVDPNHTTVLTMEMERGVVGDLARFSGPAEAARESGMIDCCASLCTAARRAGMRVVHCIAAFRPDRAGSYRNMPGVLPFMDDPEHLPVGTAATEVLPELRDDGDVESVRLHGIAPFIGTSLDPTLRSLGARTVVATGVSLNRGITGMTIEAVDLGYHVVIPRDAVAGYPAEYGKLVLEHTLANIATLTTVAELVSIWSG